MVNPIIIEDYDEKWPLLFENLKSIYLKELNDLILDIEHVGSTAIPGLAANPILDIDLIINSRELLPDIVGHLKGLGYEHEGDLGAKGREAFKRINETVPYTNPAYKKPEHHLYVCSKDKTSCC